MIPDREIGEYTGCTHGPDGTRKYGCLPCAIQFHTERYVILTERAESHLKMARLYEDEQIARNMGEGQP